MTALAKIITTGQTINPTRTTASTASRTSLRVFFVLFIGLYPLLALHSSLTLAASSLASAIIFSQSGVI